MIDGRACASSSLAPCWPPLRLVHYRDNWYLDAWCHLRQSLRNFALNAITQVTPLAQAACEVSPAKLSATFGPGYGIFSGGAVRWARLRVFR